MPHILVYDENGNVIGAEEHDPETGGREAEHEETKVVLNIGKVIELHNINVNKGKDKDD